MDENRISSGGAKSQRRNFLSLAAATTAWAVMAVLSKSDDALAGHDGTNVLHLSEANFSPSTDRPTSLNANVDQTSASTAALTINNGDGTGLKAWALAASGAPGAVGGILGVSAGNGIGLQAANFGNGIGAWGSSTGGTGVFGQSTGGAAVAGQAFGSGPGVSGSGSSGPGILGGSNTGPSGRFANSNAANSAPTLDVSTNGGGRTGQFVTTGSGAAGAFEATSPTNGSSTVLVINRGTGRAVDVLTDNANNSDSALAVRAVGQGPAGRFVKDHPTSGTPAVEGVNSGSGAGVRGIGRSGPGIEGSSEGEAGVVGRGTGNALAGVMGIAAPGGHAGVQGVSGDGIGVFAFGGSTGLVAESTNGEALHAQSENGVGVLGQTLSGRPAVRGVGSTGPGVEGVSTSGPGVVGVASQTGPGIEGFASTGTQPGLTGRPGVVGYASLTNSGVHGQSIGAAPGVIGRQEGAGGIAILARADQVGAIGLSALNAQGGIALDVSGRARFTTAGSGIIPVKADVHAVSNPAVQANSNVIATLTSDPGDAQIAWVERNPGAGFVLHMTKKISVATSFAYLITESA